MAAPSKSVHANENIKPADTPERRQFLKDSAEQRRQEAAAAAQRAAEAQARGQERAAQRLKDAETARKQAEMDRQTQEAYKRATSSGFKKGGSVKKFARGGGIESRGKTRGKFV